MKNISPISNELVQFIGDRKKHTTLFCIKHLVFGATTDLDASIQDNLFKQVYNLRVHELGAFNINTLTWIALLYIPISISFIRTG